MNLGAGIDWTPVEGSRLAQEGQMGFGLERTGNEVATDQGQFPAQGDSKWNYGY